VRILIGILVLLSSSFSIANEIAQDVFDSYKDKLYQVIVIEKSTNERVGFGSGFQVSSDGHVISNYHVVATYALHPEKYRVEYLDHLGETGELSLLRVDVINDLVMLKKPPGNAQYFKISSKDPLKGETLYSLGNPHDLGMIVVPGVYNGIRKDSFNPKVHFTGSINSGMSGGPVVNKYGELSGVNVATSGNSIGFLVPHGKVKDIIALGVGVSSETIDMQIETQLKRNHKNLTSKLLNSNWVKKSFGGAKVPSIDVPFVKCWGDSNVNDEKAYYRVLESSCYLEEDLYLADDLRSGTFDIKFYWIESEQLNPFRFASLIESFLSENFKPGNKATEAHVDNFSCNDGFVNSGASMDLKSSLCTRPYKKYPGVFDVMYIGASIGESDKALLSAFYLSGISKEDALLFSDKFIGALSWK
jgi:hypothetical protein